MKLKYLTLMAILLPIAAFAEETAKINGADTAWMLVATAFVMLMTPAGLALFYGGLTRSKNVLNTIGMSLGAYAVGTLVWVLVGYSIAFGDGDLIGTGKVMLSGITADSLTGTIPELLFVAFQGTFAAIAVAQAAVPQALVRPAPLSHTLTFIKFSLIIFARVTLHFSGKKL